MHSEGLEIYFYCSSEDQRITNQLELAARKLMTFDDGTFEVVEERDEERANT